jgi:hypothetical protein
VQSLHDLLHLRLERRGSDLHDVLLVVGVIENVICQSLGGRIRRVELMDQIGKRRSLYLELIKGIQQRRDQGPDLGVRTTQSLEIEIAEFIHPGRESPIKSGNDRSNNLDPLSH